METSYRIPLTKRSHVPRSHILKHQALHFRSLRDASRQVNESGHVSSAGKWRSYARIPIHNCHLVLYSGIIEIGTVDGDDGTEQVFRVDFDTGSSDLWVPGIDCDETCDVFNSTRSYFDPALSTTFDDMADKMDSSDLMFSAVYFDGEAVTGVRFSDTLRFPKTADLQFPNTPMAYAKHVENFEVCGDEEGMFGLGFGHPANMISPAQHLLDSELLQKNVFSFYLDMMDDHTESGELLHNKNDGSSSELILGGIDMSLYEGCLKWHKSSRPYEFAITDVTMIGSSYSILDPEEETNKAVHIDSGSTYIVAPQAVANKVAIENEANCFVYNDPMGKNMTKVDCILDKDNDSWDIALVDCNKADFKSIRFHLDENTTLHFGYDDLIEEVEMDQLTANGTKIEQQAVCVLRLQGGGRFSKDWVFGDTFFNKYFVAFDWDNERFGFAKRERERHGDNYCEDDEYLDTIFGAYSINPSPDPNYNSTNTTTTSPSPSISDSNPINPSNSTSTSPAPSIFSNSSNRTSIAPTIIMTNTTSSAPSPIMVNLTTVPSLYPTPQGSMDLVNTTEFPSHTPILSLTFSPTKSLTNNPTTKNIIKTNTPSRHPQITPTASGDDKKDENPFSFDDDEFVKTASVFLVGAILLLSLFCVIMRRRNRSSSGRPRRRGLAPVPTDDLNLEITDMSDRMIV